MTPTRTVSRTMVRVLQILTILATCGAIVLGVRAISNGGIPLIIGAILGAGLQCALLEGILALFDIADQTRPQPRQRMPELPTDPVEREAFLKFHQRQ